MSTLTANVSIIDENTTARSPVIRSAHWPIPLTEAELDFVSAAGSKPGIGSGTNPVE